MATQEQRRAHTTAALRRAGRRLFGRDGFERVSVDEIAAGAGVTRGAFYHHFASKETLFEEIFEEAEAELAEYSIDAAASGLDPRDQLLRGCLAFIERASSSRYRRIVLVDGPIVLGATRYREIDAAHFLAVLEAAVVTVEPDRDPGEVALLASVLLAGVCECAFLAAQRTAEPAAIERVVEDLIRII